ncbi:hypothetical protein BJA01nite_44650 [Bradyrhizobium japonicum]|nr:hypothetical protein BJ6T_75620 [Bradyrhizobium japonicum USDA 6]GEC46823.1 hypothetical protein BJA01nite_44650 [Bradyrhizobium japonicum]
MIAGCAASRSPNQGRLVSFPLLPLRGADMGEVVRLVTRADRERERLIREARAIYDAVFPPADPDGERPVEPRSTTRAATQSPSTSKELS